MRVCRSICNHGQFPCFNPPCLLKLQNALNLGSLESYNRLPPTILNFHFFFGITYLTRSPPFMQMLVLYPASSVIGSWCSSHVCGKSFQGALGVHSTVILERFFSISRKPACYSPVYHYPWVGGGYSRIFYAARLCLKVKTFTLSNTTFVYLWLENLSLL